MSETMTFSSAIEYLNVGCKVSRKGWNGKGMYIFLMKEDDLRKSLGGKYEDCVVLPTIAMYTHDSSGRKAILIGWLASQSDMLSDDWVIVDYGETMEGVE